MHFGCLLLTSVETSTLCFLYFVTDNKEVKRAKTKNDDVHLKTFFLLVRLPRLDLYPLIIYKIFQRLCTKKSLGFNLDFAIIKSRAHRKKEPSSIYKWKKIQWMIQILFRFYFLRLLLESTRQFELVLDTILMPLHRLFHIIYSFLQKYHSYIKQDFCISDVICKWKMFISKLSPFYIKNIDYFWVEYTHTIFKCRMVDSNSPDFRCFASAAAVLARVAPRLNLMENNKWREARYLITASWSYNCNQQILLVLFQLFFKFSWQNRRPWRHFAKKKGNWNKRKWLNVN